MSSNSYWERRAAQRMYRYQADADKIADDIAKAYIKSTNYINEQIEKVFRNFQLKNGISEDEAKKLLEHLPDNATLVGLKKSIISITDEEAKKEIISTIDSPAYAHRIGRFEQIQAEIDKQTDSLANFEQEITKKHYTTLAKDAFSQNIFEIQKGTGIAFSFGDIPKSKIEQMLKSKWSGKNFSDRIWDRRKNINQALREELLCSFLTGRGYNKTAKAVEQRMAAGAMEARRLVRTESAYIEETAELESYKECDIKKLRFLATLDMRTSEICAVHDGEIIEIDKAVSGVNIPPLHPWCRSTTIAVFDDDIVKKLKRRAKDPETGEDMLVPANMTYEEWKEGILQKYGNGYVFKTRKKIRNSTTDKEQFTRYSNVLKELAPKTLDEFTEIKYNYADKWDVLKYQYRTVNRYEIDGDVSIEEVLKLDNAAWYTKQNAFPYKHILDKDLRERIKKMPKEGNAASMLFNDKIYFSHSRFGLEGTDELAAYVGKYPTVGLQANRRFITKPISSGDTIAREFDTEAKFLEFVATKMDPKDTFTVTILSEKHICASCQGVVEQFEKMFPKSTVNIVSGKLGYNKSEDGLKTWYQRRKAHNKRKKAKNNGRV